MKFYKNLLRLILTAAILAAITLVVCVATLNSGRDDPPSAGFSERMLAVSDHADNLPRPDSSPDGPESDGNSENNEDEESGEAAKEEALPAESPEALTAEENALPVGGSDASAPINGFWGELPRIVCFGDSLTESTDNKTAYPDLLKQLTGAEVINYGIRSDTTAMIAARAGYIGLYTNEFKIPEESVPVNLSIHTSSGNQLPILRYGDNGINPCYINGVKGRLSRSKGAYFFTRESAGEITAVPEGSRITTWAMAGKNSKDVLILFTGTNDTPDRYSIKDIISMQRGMIEYTGREKFVVIGLTCKQIMPDIEAVNEALYTEYGDNFLDVRTFMLEKGLEYEGLKASEGDRVDIKNGEIPRSLRVDYVHGNIYFNDIIANLLYEKLKYLGYLPLEEKEE